MKCESWTITANGILINADDNKSGEEIIMTPNWLDLTLWKAAYYDRGKILRNRHDRTRENDNAIFLGQV